MIGSDDCSLKLGLVLVDYCSSLIFAQHSQYGFHLHVLVVATAFAVALIVIMIMVAVIRIIEMVVFIFIVFGCLRKLRTPSQIPSMEIWSGVGMLGQACW